MVSKTVDSMTISPIYSFSTSFQVRDLGGGKGLSIDSLYLAAIKGLDWKDFVGKEQRKQLDENPWFNR